ncbi:MAG: hypothetical protein CVU60_11850 [Deltaproteobacteria bacterium HGW-Deltaproteobacteria-18]|jgi:hypothetical protein|nr:MAG: hypothetical protein CVU60_11850 [Deltaproteobacteria bacterium HGW-Deltaproteobacteria-18]
MDFLFERLTYMFDPLHHFWEHERMHRRFALGLIVVFLGALVSIELNRQGLLPASLAAHTPTNHFHAVNLAFTLVLILEVISLIFTLPCSFSKSVGKQFEILSLILLRDAFKELSYFAEPITVGTELTPVFHILGYGFGALAIFALLGVYYRIQPGKKQDMGLPHDLFRFVAAKKGIALLILITFFVLGLGNLYNKIAGLPHIDFFPVFYNLLIFTDILVVLISQCFRPSFHAVFRNSGYALSTLFIRLALAAPPMYDVALGIVAALFSIALTLAWTRVFTNIKT